MTQLAATPTAPKKLNLLLMLPGMAVWALIITGLTTENHTLIGVGVALIAVGIVARLGRSISRSSAERAENARIWQQGLPATANIVSIAERGGMNGHPRVHFDLEIRPRSGAPYRVATDVLISRLAIPRIQPGTLIDVRVDPRDPSNILVDEALTYLGYRG